MDGRALAARIREKLKQEIEHLSTAKRREVADRIRIAREFGDIAQVVATMMMMVVTEIIAVRVT